MADDVALQRAKEAADAAAAAATQAAAAHQQQLIQQGCAYLGAGPVGTTAAQYQVGGGPLRPPAATTPTVAGSLHTIAGVNAAMDEASEVDDEA